MFHSRVGLLLLFGRKLHTQFNSLNQLHRIWLVILWYFSNCDDHYFIPGFDLCNANFQSFNSLISFEFSWLKQVKKILQNIFNYAYFIYMYCVFSLSIYYRNHRIFWTDNFFIWCLFNSNSHENKCFEIIKKKKILLNVFETVESLFGNSLFLGIIRQNKTFN